MSEPTLFGFALRGEVPFRFARDGGGSVPLTVRYGPADVQRPREGFVVEWPLKGTETAVMASLYDVPGGYEYWTTDAGRFFVNAREAVLEVPPIADAILREQRTNGIPLALAYTERGDLALHAAAVEVGGRAVLLAAPSRFGKTTLAMAFHARGYPMLAEDMICINMASGSVLPGPAVIRLRPDVYGGRPPSGLEEVARRPDRVFLSPPVGQRGRGAPRPLRAIVFLREGAAIEVSPAAPVEALKDLWALNFRLPTNEGREASFRGLSALLREIPAYNLRRPFQLDALDATIDAVVSCLEI